MSFTHLRKKNFSRELRGSPSLSCYHKVGKCERKRGRVLKREMKDTNFWLFQSLADDQC